MMVNLGFILIILAIKLSINELVGIALANLLAVRYLRRGL